ncbi:MAG: hypothetical protein MJ099_05845, partial [Clostridia bacterium]|nr:hypothetical protein [Clostridia bacterium]
YLAGEHYCERVALTETDRYEETVMLFTRLTSGLDLDASASVIGRDFVVRHQKKIDRLTEAGLIELKDGHLRLTEHGLELQNAVVVELLD